MVIVLGFGFQVIQWGVLWFSFDVNILILGLFNFDFNLLNVVWFSDYLVLLLWNLWLVLFVFVFSFFGKWEIDSVNF